ncbi:MAG TPA: type II TA system antitoxin MqsA family protein [Oscillatoriaceae cyanobacterium]
MEERCAICRQGTAHEIVAPDEVRIPGARFVIADDRRMRCERCGEEYYTGEQADEHQRKVDQLKRDAYKPLAPEEIRAIRAKVKLSQHKLEEVIGLGSNTLNRWERGIAPPSRLVDNMLRLVDRDPAVLEFLAARSGVQLTPKARPGRKAGSMGKAYGEQRRS